MITATGGFGVVRWAILAWALFRCAVALATESVLCSYGGADTLDGAIGLAKAVQESENRPALTKPAADSVALALLVAASCPETAEGVFNDSSDTEVFWIRLKTLWVPPSQPIRLG